MASVTEEIVKNSSWLTPEIVVPAVCVIIASVVIPLLLHYLKGKRERDDKILEIRTKVYTEYFKKYEETASNVGQDYEHFSKVTMKDAFFKLLQSKSSPEAIVEYQETVGNFPHMIQDSHRKATEEITTLKILGSNELLKLTEEFEELNHEILNLSSAWLQEIQSTMLQPDFEAPIAQQMKKLGQRAKELKNLIIKQMRDEIRLN